MKHKSRRELRVEGEKANAELALLKTPEGLAAFLFSKRDDEEFSAAVEAELTRLGGVEFQASLDAAGAELDGSAVEGSVLNAPVIE